MSRAAICRAGDALIYSTRLSRLMSISTRRPTVEVSDLRALRRFHNTGWGFLVSARPKLGVWTPGGDIEVSPQVMAANMRTNEAERPALPQPGDADLTDYTETSTLPVLTSGRRFV